MKIPNYDGNKMDNEKRSLCNFLTEDYRMLICGFSSCGKTNVLIHIIKEPLVYFDKIYIYTPNKHEEKLVDLQKFMDKISKEVKYKVLEIKEPNEIPDTSEYKEGNRKLVVFDDLLNSPDKIQNKIANHFTDGRHHQISPIYISQSYYDTPQKLRLNCSHMILYPPTTKNHCLLIGKENMIDPKLFNTLKSFEFLFIDKNNKSVKKTLMKQYKLIIYELLC